MKRLFYIQLTTLPTPGAEVTPALVKIDNRALLSPNVARSPEEQQTLSTKILQEIVHAVEDEAGRGSPDDGSGGTSGHPSHSGIRCSQKP